MATINATVIDSLAAGGLPPNISVTYTAAISVGAGGIAADLIALELPATTTDEAGMLPINNPSGLAYGINISAFACASQSEEYSIRIFNVEELDGEDTINEVIVYTEVQYSIVDDDYSDYIIKNCDTPQTNKLYVLLENTGSTPITSVDIKLVYKSAQDKLPTNI
jgi:hypothetical protein